MKKVFISFAGTVSTKKEEGTIATANMHCSNPRAYDAAITEVNYVVNRFSDIEKMNYDWANACQQSPYGGTFTYYFENINCI